MLLRLLVNIAGDLLNQLLHGRENLMQQSMAQIVHSQALVVLPAQ